MGHIRKHTVPVNEIELGNICVFRDGNQPCHVGIFATLYDRVSIIHAYSGIGKVIEEPYDHQWPSKLVEIRALREFE